MSPEQFGISHTRELRFEHLAEIGRVGEVISDVAEGFNGVLKGVRNFLRRRGGKQTLQQALVLGGSLVNVGESVRESPLGTFALHHRGGRSDSRSLGKLQREASVPLGPILHVSRLPQTGARGWTSVPECHQRIDQEACATDNSVECASVLFKLLAGPLRSRSARTAHSVSGFLSLPLPTAAGKCSRPSPGGATTKTANRSLSSLPASCRFQRRRQLNWPPTCKGRGTRSGWNPAVWPRRRARSDGRASS